MIEYLIQAPSQARNNISINSPFDENDLKKYRDLINWDHISHNYHIEWTKPMIRSYKQYLNWERFSMNPIFQDISTIDEFLHEIEWGYGNDGLCTFSIAWNRDIKWTSELIDNYLNYFNFKHLSKSWSVDWSAQLLKNYKDRWNWDGILSNPSIKWTLPMLEETLLYKDLRSIFWFELNGSLSGSLEIVEKYFDDFNSFTIFSNKNLPWVEKNLLERWKDKLDWRGLAYNEVFHSDREFFENNLDKWMSLPNLSAFEGFSGSKTLPWSTNLIDRFIFYWNWKVLSRNSALPWNESLIDRYRNYWDWNAIAQNYGIKWTLELLSKYEELSCVTILKNPVVWDEAFKPYLDRKSLDIILRLSA